MHDLSEILAHLRRLSPDLYRRYPVRDLAVFGSFARGEQDEASDLDVLADMEEGATLIDVVGLKQDLCDALGLEVDVVTTGSLAPEVRASVERDLVHLQ